MNRDRFARARASASFGWRRTLPIVAAVALAVRIIYIAELFWKDPFFHHLPLGSDSLVYWTRATAIAEGDVLMKAFGPYYFGPLYSYFLAGLFALSEPSLWTVHVVQGMLGVVSCVLIALIATMAFNRITGLIAGLLAAFSTTLLYYEQRVLMESLLFVIISGGLAAFMTALVSRRRTPHLLWCATAGLCIGVAAAGRGTHLLLAGALVLVLGLQRLRPRRQRLLSVAVLLSLAVLPPSLMALRNGLLFERWVPTTNGPITLYFGNAPDAIGIYVPPKSLEEKMEDGKNPSDEWMKKMMIKHVTERPLHFLGLQLRKLHFFFSVWDIPNNYSYAIIRRYSVLTRWSPSSFWLFMPMGLVGLTLAVVRRPVRARRLIIVLGAITVGGMCCHVVGRFKLPALIIMIPCSAYLLDVLRRSARRRLPLVIGTIIAVAVLALILRPSLPMRTPPGNYYLTAMQHLRRGERMKAIELLTEAAVLWPDKPRLREALQQITGRPPERP